MGATQEYFIHGRTFAAPIVSEDITRYREAATPREALLELAAELRDGIGLFAGAAYASADDYHRNREPMARFLSNRAQAVQGAVVVDATAGRERELVVDGEKVEISDPRGGAIVEAF